MYSFHKIKAAAAMLMVGVLLATAFTATAQAGSGTRQGLTAEQSKAVRARAQAMDRYYHLGAHSPAAVAQAGREAPRTGDRPVLPPRKLRRHRGVEPVPMVRCGHRGGRDARHDPGGRRRRDRASAPRSRQAVVFNHRVSRAVRCLPGERPFFRPFCAWPPSSSGRRPARPGRSTRHGTVGSSPVRVRVRPGAIDLFRHASIIVGGLTGARLEVRLVGAIDRHGPAYEWTPYPWRRLRPLHGTWRGVLPAPPLFGIYSLQLRLDNGKLFSSPRWLLRVFPRGVLGRPSFPTAAGAIRNFVAHLRGDQVLVALKRWPLAAFDHRDPRLNRLFVIAYAPRAHDRPSSRLGRFVTIVRDGFHGRWRLLKRARGPTIERSPGWHRR